MQLLKKTIGLHWFLYLYLIFSLTSLPIFAETKTNPPQETVDQAGKAQASSIKTQAAATNTGTEFTLVQDHFQLDEINISQGSLEFSETDLILPGKNGLDVILGRKYSSTYCDQDRFGMPKGWAMTFDMKLYSSNIDDKSYILTADGAKEYHWWSSRGAISTTVSDFSCIKDHWNSGTNGEWKLYGEDGKKYTFTFWSLNSQDQRAYLTSIEDKYGNKIIITRENGPNDDRRIQKITDTFGREIKFYYENSNGNLVTKITYKNTNGIDQNIVYRYDTNGCLAGVKAENLPEKTYGYGLHKIEQSDAEARTGIIHSTFEYKDQSGNTVKLDKLYNFSQETNWINLYGQVRATQSSDQRIIDAWLNYGKNRIGTCSNRYFLMRNNSPLGGYIEYGYSDSKSNTNLIRVISSKTINESSGIKTIFSIAYPLGIGIDEYNQNSYSTSIRSSETGLSSRDIYAFASATVTNPLSITPEAYTFNKGLPTVKTQGIISTETTWNYDKMLPTQVTNKKNSIVQSATKTEYGAYNNPTKITTQKGNSDYIIQETSYYTDSSFIDQNILHLPKLTSVSDVNTGIKRYNYTTYTTQGKPYESYEGQDSSGRKLATLTYDSTGRVLTQSQYGPGGTMTVQYGYNLSGSIYTITQTVNGKTSTSVYETNTGKLKSSTDLNNATSTYVYDDYGRPIQLTYPDGQTAQTSYSTDLKTTTTTAGGRTFISKLDSLGRTIEIDNPIGEDSVKYTYYYGNLPSTVSKQSNGSGAWVQKKSYTYDSYLRKLTSTNTDFGTTSYSYNDSTNTVSITDPLGRTSTSKTDELGRTIQSQFVPDSSTTSSTYDAFGNVLTVTDPRNLIHKTDYDAYGRVISSYHTGANAGNLAKRSQTTYTSGAITQTQQFSTGNVLFRTYGFTYDNEGRLTTTTLGGSSVETLTYDQAIQENAKGRLTTAENTDAKTQYDYDLLGRIKRETTTIKPLTKTVAINYTYNATNGNLASYSYPDGKAVTYTYDNNQRVKTMSYNGKLIATYTYNSNGTIQTLTYGNNTAIAYTYEKEVLLKSLTATSPQNGQLYTQAYTYDTVGRATQTQHNDYFSSTGTLTRDYTYTPKNELKTVAINSTPTYTNNYDKNSNHLRLETQHNKGLTGDNMVIDPTNDHLIKKIHKDGKTITFKYDPAGNMIEKSRTWSDGSQGQKLTYTYNYQDQIAQANDSGYNVMTAGYDHENQRVYTDMPGINPWNGQKFYYWNQSGAIIGEGKVGVNDYVARYFYSGNQKIAMERYDQTTGTSSFYYFINNAQGTPVLIVDEQNNAISKINLDEWGNVGDKTTGPQQEINYTGKKMDIPTRLYYFNQRYYDPEIGRFVNEDPAGQGINPYAYCGNNPLLYTDPDGQLFTEIFTALCPGLGSILGAALDGGLISAGINATAQLAITGRIDGQNVLNAFGSGALSGGLANMIGGVGGVFKEFGGESLLTKTLAHGVSGGLQSMAGGGSFGSGFAGGAIGNLAGGLGGTDIASRTLFAGLGAGAAAWATGGDFWQGAQAGAYNQMYNWGMHEGLELLGDASNALEASGVLPMMEAGIVGNGIVGGVEIIEETSATVGKLIQGYTKHGINQAISREGVGVHPEAILQAVKNPQKIIKQANGTIKYVSGKASVVLNKLGQIVTVFGSPTRVK